MSEFPAKKYKCPSAISEYWNICDELSYVHGMKIVIPHKLRREMLAKIHVGHFGIEKCHRRACEVLYQPRMNQSISEMVKSCLTYLEDRPMQALKPLMPHPVASYPWEKIGVDLCVFEKANYLIICDYYSNFQNCVNYSQHQAIW